jgi:hypothetical protein
VADQLEYTQFDTSPAIEEDLEQRNPDTGAWEPLDVEGKTVRLLAQHQKSGRRFGGVAVKLAVAGKSRFRYALQAQDLAEPGDYWWEWEISTPTGERRTIGRYELNVRAKLGAVV